MSLSRSIARLTRRPRWRAAAGAVFSVTAGCSLLIDVDHCSSDEQCGDGRTCRGGRCRTLQPLDATGSVFVDASSGSGDADGGGDALPPEDVCDSTNVPGVLATYSFTNGAGRRLEAALDHAVFDEGTLGFRPEGRFDARWDARFRVPNPLKGTFTLETTGTARLLIDQVLVIEGRGGSTVDVDLSPGTHALSLEVAGLHAGGRVSLSSAGPGDPARLVGAPAFTAAADCDGARGACQAVDDTAIFTVEANVFHCGACGRACTQESGPTECVAGRCRPLCPEGYEDADGDVRNGCEAQVLRGVVCGVTDRSGTVRLEDVEVCAYQDGAGEGAGSGSIDVTADIIIVAGRIDARGRGYGGGGGGGGGGGTERCGEPTCDGVVAAIRAGAGGRGDGLGLSGDDGEQGRSSNCFERLDLAGGGRVGWPRGRGVRWRRRSRRRAARGDGTGAVRRTRCRRWLLGRRHQRRRLDATLSVLAGRAGAAVVVARAGSRSTWLLHGRRSAVGAARAAPEAGAVSLRGARAASRCIERRGDLITAGGPLADRERRGGGGLPGGAGGDADAFGAPAWVAAASGADHDVQRPIPELSGAAPSGARGGGGAGGGGVLLMAPTVVHSRARSTRGARSSEHNGGTVKIATCGESPSVDKVHAGRVVPDLRLPDCP
jgi:hypothetical protein